VGLEFWTLFLFASLLFAEMTRMGGGKTWVYFFTLIMWPVAVPLVLVSFYRRGKSNVTRE
jgi:hypothetical protein